MKNENAIIVIEDDFSIWNLPARDVALARTKYYAEKDGFSEGSAEWEQEYAFSLNDAYELEEWITQNSDPSEWENLKLIERKKYPGIDWDKCEITVEYL